MSGAILGGLLGPPTLSDIEGMPDPAPDWRWTADILNIGNLLPLQNIYVKEITWGLLLLDYEQRYRDGIYYTFPRHAQTHPVNITFYEPYNFLVTQYLNSWRLLIRDNNGNYGIPSQYFGVIIVRMYDTTGLMQFAAKIDGVWPMAQQQFNLQYNVSGPIVTACDFAIQNVEILYTGGIIGSLLGQGASGISGINLIGSLASGVQTGSKIASLVKLF